MQKQRVKTSMSVPEMGKMLGLGKVESYWLVKKNYFKTIQVAGRMRVMLDSFEDWYAGQFHYKTVDGTPPGEKWRHTTMSVPEMADLLGLKSGTAYDLVKRGYFETTLAFPMGRQPQDCSRYILHPVLPLSYPALL